MEKWQALYTLLEAFGNSPTIMNGNATRFSQILSLDFDQAGQVASASIQVRGHCQGLGSRDGPLVSPPRNQSLSSASFSWDSALTKWTPVQMGLACAVSPSCPPGFLSALELSSLYCGYLAVPSF